MRRHLRNSHKRTDLLNDELSYKCKICNKLFWSIAERTVHIAENHKEASENLEKCFICFHISPNRHALRRHFQRMHPKEPLFENVSFKCGDCGLLYPQRQLLSTHIKAEHPKAITYQCAYCPQQRKNKKSQQSYVNQHKKANRCCILYLFHHLQWLELGREEEIIGWVSSSKSINRNIDCQQGREREVHHADV